MELINTFAGSPVNRMGNERRDKDWLHQQMDDPNTGFLPLWQLRALMVPGKNQKKLPKFAPNA